MTMKTENFSGELKNAMTRSEMKNILGGLQAAAVCDSWAKQAYEVCYQCCITVHSMTDCAGKYC